MADVYGEGRVFEAGVLSREDVEASPHYEPAMRGRRAARAGSRSPASTSCAATTAASA